MVENVTLVICFDVLCCLDPNDGNDLQVDAGTVTDHEVESVTSP